MAHHASAKKAYRQSEKNRINNKSRISEVRTYIKKVESAVAAKDLTQAEEAFKLAQGKLLRAVQKNILKLNNASRKISRLAHKIKAITKAA